MEIVISTSLANVSGVTTEEAINFLLDHDEELEVYERVRVPNRIYAASEDFIIIELASNFFNILTSLLIVYDRLIKPTKKEESNAGIYINITYPSTHERPHTFWIGNEIKTAEQLMESANRFLKENGFDERLNIENVELTRKGKHMRKLKKKKK